MADASPEGVGVEVDGAGVVGAAVVGVGVAGADVVGTGVAGADVDGDAVGVGRGATKDAGFGDDVLVGAGAELA